VSTCGDAENGFVLLINYNTLTDGTHLIELFDNGVLFASKMFTVVTPGEEFLKDATGATMAVDFPAAGQATMLEWDEPSQNWKMTGIIGLPEE